jgi:hypothetical protein
MQRSPSHWTSARLAQNAHDFRDSRTPQQQRIIPPDNDGQPPICFTLQLAGIRGGTAGRADGAHYGTDGKTHEALLGHPEDIG